MTTEDAVTSSAFDNPAGELHRWHQLLTTLNVAWSATATQLRDMPGHDSPVGREDLWLANVHPDWGPHEALHAGLDAVALIAAAAKHVSGLGSLVADRNLVLAPWPLVRSEVEHIAYGGWLLDPAINPEQRVARRWMLKLAEAYRFRWAASSIRASKASIKEVRRSRDQVQAEFARKFPDADLDWSLEDSPSGPPWVVAGQRYPGLAAATRRFVEYGGFSDIPGLYDRLSLLVHPNLSTALARSVRTVHHEDFTEFSYQADFTQTIRLLRLASTFLYRAGRVVCSYFELDPTLLEEWADSLHPETTASEPHAASDAASENDR